MDKIANYYLGHNSRIETEIPVGKNVILEIGCAAGVLGKRLRERNKVDRIIGVELCDSAAREAKKIYDEVIVGNIENLELQYRNIFDFVICGDVLEHLKEPGAVLKKINTMLKLNGVLIASIPNVRHWRVILNLVFYGRWEYQNTGTMDKTHLRYFTRRSFSRLLLENNYSIKFCQGIIPRRSMKILNYVTCNIFKEFFYYQLLYKCCSNPSHQTSQAQ